MTLLNKRILAFACALGVSMFLFGAPGFLPGVLAGLVAVAAVGKEA